MKITTLERHTSQWDEYVQNSSKASFYHLSAWRELLEGYLGHPTYYLMAEDDDGVKGILPLVHLKSRVFGDSLVSLPYFMSGGVVADSEESRDLLLEQAVSLMQTTSSKLLLIRHQGEVLPGLQRDDSKGCFHIALDPDPDKVFQRITRQVRRRIRKAQQSGLVAEWGAGCLHEFYEVYSRNMRDLGIPIHASGFFETILGRFPGQAHVFVIKSGREPVAGQFLFTFRDRVMLVCAGSLRSRLALNPNHALYWESVRYGCENGYTICDFGRSPKGSGPYVFKSQWSGEEREYPTYYLDASESALGSVSSSNTRYDLVRSLWRRLPVRVTNLIGPSIVKSLP